MAGDDSLLGIVASSFNDKPGSREGLSIEGNSEPIGWVSGAEELRGRESLVFIAYGTPRSYLLGQEVEVDCNKWRLSGRRDNW